MNTTFKLKATASLGRGTSRNDEFTLQVEDKSSGVLIFEMTFHPDRLADLLSNRGAVPVEVELFDGSDRWGLVHEHKTIPVPFDVDPPRTYTRKMPEGVFAAWHGAIVNPYEVDGWKADIEASINNHRLGKGTYSTIFRRYVQPAETP